MTVKYISMKGADHLADNPFYVALVQHERTLSKREFYDLAAEFVRENQARGNITCLDGIASIRNYIRGSFDALTGPWVKGRNHLAVKAVAVDPFKTLLAAIVPVNNTEGAKPVINTVLDETTMVYDEITGTDTFSIAGADLAPDSTKDDEYVALASAQGVETKCAVDYSDLQNVKAHLASAVPAGQYTLKVYTRSGLGDRFGVHVATRKVTVK